MFFVVAISNQNLGWIGMLLNYGEGSGVAYTWQFLLF